MAPSVSSTRTRCSWGRSRSPTNQWHRRSQHGCHTQPGFGEQGLGYHGRVGNCLYVGLRTEQQQPAVTFPMTMKSSSTTLRLRRLSGQLKTIALHTRKISTASIRSRPVTGTWPPHQYAGACQANHQKDPHQGPSADPASGGIAVPCWPTPGNPAAGPGSAVLGNYRVDWGRRDGSICFISQGGGQHQQPGPDQIHHDDPYPVLGQLEGIGAGHYGAGSWR